MRAWFPALVAAALALVAGAQPPAQSFESYSFDRADLAAAAEAARALVGPEGSVVPDEAGGRLLVVTTPERHAQVADLARKLASPPLNVQIEVQFRETSFGHQAGASLEAAGGVERSEGVTHTTIRVRPRVENTTAGSSGGAVQSLLVGSGREGRIRVGESVPYLEWIADYGFRWGWTRERVGWQEVGSFLVVEPTVVGGGPMIRIRVTPELSGLVNGHPYHTRFAQAATEIVAQDGQTFQIGAVDEHREFYSRFLVGGAKGSVGRQVNISLTPRILGAPAP